jgi:hypothetical protein
VPQSPASRGGHSQLCKIEIDRERERRLEKLQHHQYHHHHHHHTANNTAIFNVKLTDRGEEQAEQRESEIVKLQSNLYVRTATTEHHHHHSRLCIWFGWTDGRSTDRAANSDSSRASLAANYTTLNQYIY